MRSSLPSRVTAWLCLALLLVTGLTPARDYVLCLEADGCVNLEAGSPADPCDACDDHRDPRDAFEIAAMHDNATGCACTDLLVPSSSEAVTAKLRSIAGSGGPWISQSAVIRFDPTGQRAARRSDRPPEFPRIAQSLAHIRSVVLLV